MGMQMELNGLGAVRQLFNGNGAVHEFEHGNRDEDRGGNGAVRGHGVGVATRIAKGLCRELGKRVADGDKVWGCA